MIALYCLPTMAQEQAEYTLSLDNASVVDLVRWVSDIVDETIVIHPSVQGRVTVVAGEPMNADEAYQVFLTALQLNGFALVREGNAITVVPGAQAREGALPVLTDESSQASSETVIQVVRLQNVSANNVLNLLRPLIPQTSYISAYPDSNILIVADSGRNIAKLLNLINEVDLAGSIEIELLPVEFADAQQIVNTIQSLIPQQADSGASFTLAIDERSNSILMTGDPFTKQQIVALVRRLDAPLSGTGNTQILRIQYADAEEVRTILEGVSQSLQQQNRDQSLTNTEVSLQVHAQQNAIIITAPPSILTVLRGIAAELDTPRAQVLVEAIIVEVNQDLVNDIGVEWLSGASEQVIGGFNAYPSSLAPLSILEDGSFSLGTGLSLGYLSGGGNLKATLNALAAATNANILSTPTIMALDNEEATILVGSNVPFITGTEQREGDNPFQTIERQDIGITLRIRPQVNNDDSVTLEIEQSVESIGQAAAATADIVTNKREITTKVLIRHDQILVLGGLIQDEASEIESKVPLLGDIPLLGRIFKSTSTSVVKKNLMVFIHPLILRDNAAASAISEDQYEYMIDLQQNFNRSIDPVEKFWILSDPPTLPDFE